MDLPFWSIIVAAGESRRLAGGRPKQYRRLGGKPLLLHALESFARHADPARLVLVLPAGDESEVLSMIQHKLPALPVLVAGGATRQESVRRGLAAIPDEDGWVAVHDAARPFFDGRLLHAWRRQLESLGEKAALVPVLPLADTVLRMSDEPAFAAPEAPGSAAERLDRHGLTRVQTPQLFRLPLLRRAHEGALARGETDASDDGGLVLALGERLATVPGDPGNLKITTAADWRRAEERLAGEPSGFARMGLGYDSHRLDPGRPLILGGVTVPSEVGGLAGHSDADVLVHAVMDALLGAAALGDIGQHFPDTDPRYAGADSLALLGRVMTLLATSGYAPGHVDVTLIAERPKLAPHIPAMREKLATALGLSAEHVSVKAKTNEGMGAVGRGEGMAALAIASLREISSREEIS